MLTLRTEVWAMSLGLRIKTLRRSKGLTQKRLLKWSMSVAFISSP